MEIEQTWTVYVRLWGRCEGCSGGPEASTLVHYIGPEEVRVGEAGFFHPQGADRAQSEIAIARCGYGHHHQSAPTRERQDGARLNHDEMLAELFVLAHELGHSRSWREGQRPPAYEEAVLAFDEGLPLSDEQQRLILEEEDRAWRYARQELDSLGFSEWARFDATRRSGLDAYQQTFWPTAR